MEPTILHEQSITYKLNNKRKQTCCVWKLIFESMHKVHIDIDAMLHMENKNAILTR